MIDLKIKEGSDDFFERPVIPKEIWSRL